MPVFNLELQFDDSGALTAVRQIDNIAKASYGASKKVKGIGEDAKNSSSEVSKMGEKGAAAADKITSAMKKAATQVLALVGAYKAVNGAMSFVNRGMQFNSSLEQSKIGIASIITSMVKLEDVQGNVLEGAEKYQAAQGMAAELMQKIQKLGLETTATTESLVEGVQSIMGPALQAGMALEDIPEFAVAGAQAMQTLGVPLNQMRTELDALLTGVVNKSQDILAPKLFADVQGDLGAYIKNLKESGKLIDEIKARLKPFQLAGQDVAQTWAGLTSNLEEALDKLAGDTSLGFTKHIKEAVNDLQGLLLSEGNNTVGISENFKNIATLLGEINDWIGSKIHSSIQGLIELTKEFNAFLGSDAGIEALDTLILTLKLATAALSGFAIARGVAFAVDKWNAIITSIKTYKDELTKTAKAQLVSAKTASSAYDNYIKSAKGQKEIAKSAEAKNAVYAKQKILIDQVAAAEQRLNSIQSKSMASNALSASIKGLMGAFGGPVGLAITGITTAIGYYAVKSSEAASLTDMHSQAQERFARTLGNSVDEAGKLTRVLNEVEIAETKATKRELEKAWSEQLRALSSDLKDIEKDFNDFWSGLEPEERGEFSDELFAIDKVKDLTEQFRAGKINLDEYKVALNGVYEGLNGTSSAIAQFIDTLIKDDKIKLTAEDLRVVNQVLEDVEQGSKKTAKAVQESKKSFEDLKKGVESLDSVEKNNVNTLEGALKWLEKRNSTTKEGEKIQEAMAKATDMAALATLNAAIATAEFNAAAANTSLLSGNITDEMIQVASEANHIVVQLKSAKEAIVKGMATPEWGGGGKKGGKGKTGGSGMSAENAAEKWKDLSDQLAQLEGKATSSAASLDKTLKSIEDTGKAAKKSAQEINEMKEAFIAATDKKSLQDLNKELLQLEGNTKALQNIERQEKTDQLRAKINDIRSLTEDEKKILLNRVDTAVQQEFKVKDMQTAVDFMKDLESLGGSYGESIAMQNQLIEYQAALYRDNLGPEFEGYVAQWERLKILGNDKSFMAGLERGVRKFGADYGDVANQVEQLTTQMGSTISNTLADAFMKGKFSAQDFFSSLISMAAQAMSNAFIGQIFSGAGNVLGGLFGGGSNISAAQELVPQFFTAGAFHTGGMVGKDYTFKRNVPLSSFYDAPRFHSGGGFFNYGEYPAILKAGERVLNPAETRAYNAGQSSIGSIASSNPIFNVNIVNESGSPMQAQGEATPNSSGGFDIDIIVSQLEQKIVDRAKHGKSQLMQYQETAYCMSRAGVLARGRGRA